MAKYSIKELEKFSGIKAHTLRIWEKRFNLLEPKRTDTNIRYYCDDDLKKLLNVTLLCNNGMKISQIAELSKNDLCEEIKKLEGEDNANQRRLDGFIKAMIDLDEDQFHKLFDQSVEEVGFEKTLSSIIYPFLEKIGVLWLSDEIQPRHEHFTTYLIRNKMVSAIDDLPFNSSDKRAVLFLPEGEYHELGLLYLYYIIKKRGIRVYYLGQSVPSTQVQLLIEKVKPHWTITYSIIKKKAEIEDLLNEMCDFSEGKSFFLENKSQNNMDLDYPKEVNRLANMKNLLSIFS